MSRPYAVGCVSHFGGCRLGGWFREVLPHPGVSRSPYLLPLVLGLGGPTVRPHCPPASCPPELPSGGAGPSLAPCGTRWSCLLGGPLLPPGGRTNTGLRFRASGQPQSSTASSDKAFEDWLDEDLGSYQG